MLLIQAACEKVYKELKLNKKTEMNKTSASRKISRSQKIGMKLYCNVLSRVCKKKTREL